MPELTHAELSAEHYRLIRTNPSYRNFLHIQELELHQEPSQASIWGELEPKEEEEPSILVRGLTHQERDEINQLKAKLLWFQNKFNEHIDASKKKEGGIYE